MLEIKNINKTYITENGKRVIDALKNINLSFFSSGFVCITGKSGSGKSTLLNILGGLDSFDSGELLIKGKSSSTFNPKDFDSYRNTYLGFVFQEFNLLENYTVQQNIEIALMLQGISSNDSEVKVDEITKQLDIYEQRHQKICEISGGQKQRTAIGRALVKNPAIIIADEPTGNLDSYSSKIILDILKEISKFTLVIMVSHDIDYCEIYGDRIITLKDGEIESDTYKSNELEKSSINDGFKLTESKLPLKSAFHMCLSSLFRKKIKFVIMILLLFVSVTLFGISMLVNTYDFSNSYSNTGELLQLKSQVYSTNNIEDVDENLLSDTFLSNMRNRYPNTTFIPMYSDPSTEEINICKQDSSNFYREVCNFYTDKVSSFEGFKGHIIEGTLSNEKGNIIIPDFIGEALISDIGKYSEYSLLSELLDTGTTYRITGIYSTELTLSDYMSEYNKEQLPDYSNLASFPILKYYTDDHKITYNVSNASSGNEKKVEFNHFWEEDTIADKEIHENITYIDFYNSTDEGVYINIAKFQFISNNFCSVIIDHLCSDQIANFGAFDLEFSFQMSNIESEDLVVKGVFYDESSYDMVDIVIGKIGNKIIYPTNKDNVKVYNRLMVYFDSNEYDVIPELMENLSLNQLQSPMFLVNKLDNGFAQLNTLFFSISILFGLFSFLMILHFISESVLLKRKQIGTLRAIGASGRDTALIFMLEAILISIITSTFGSIGLSVFVMFLNSEVSNILGVSIVILKANALHYIYITLFTFFISFISSYVPLKRTSNMKPINAIKNN